MGGAGLALGQTCRNNAYKPLGCHFNHFAPPCTSLCSLCSTRKTRSGNTAPAALPEDQAALDDRSKNSNNLRRIHNARREEFERGAGRKSSLSPPNEDKRSPKSTATADTESSSESSSEDSDSDVGSKTALKRNAFQSRAAKSAAKRSTSGARSRFKTWASTAPTA